MYLDTQGIPSNSPQVQVSDLAVADLHRGSILGGKATGKGGGEEALGLAVFGSNEDGEGAGKADYSRLGSVVHQAGTRAVVAGLVASPGIQ